MDKETVIALARKADVPGPTVWDDELIAEVLAPHLERFATLVAREERKRICDMLIKMHTQEERHNYFLFIANIIKESA